jgi:hypothetical protein
MPTASTGIERLKCFIQLEDTVIFREPLQVENKNKIKKHFGQDEKTT